MELTTTHQIHYSNKEHIPLSEIADSLLALESLIRQTPDILESLFPGTKISGIEVYLSELKSGSLFEEVLVKFFFSSQQTLDTLVQNLRERLGLQHLQNNQLLSAIIIILILTGGAYYYGKANTGEENKAKLEVNNNFIINLGADFIEMKSAEFRSALEAGIKDKDKLAKDAVRFVKPAKRDPEAHIRFDNDKKLQINPETVKAMPSHIAEADPVEIVEDFDRVEVLIRAVDLDSHRKGWAAIISDISERRVKLHLDPHIDGGTLMLHPAAIANVTAIFKSDEEGKKIPILYFLREVHEFK